MSDRDSVKGVPFRLSKKFYPLSRPQFRDIDIHIPLDALLQDEYDFTLETEMIQKYEDHLEETERLRIIASERSKELQEQLPPQNPSPLQPSTVSEMWNSDMKEQVTRENPSPLQHSNRTEMWSTDLKEQIHLQNPIPLQHPTRSEMWSTDLQHEHIPQNPIPLQHHTRSEMWSTDLKEQVTLENPLQHSTRSEMWSTDLKEQIHLQNPIPIQHPTRLEMWSNDLQQEHLPLQPNSLPLQQPKPIPSAVSNSNSFTKLHFPFLSSYTQENTKDRELERALERSYHQHYQQQQQQQYNNMPASSTNRIPNGTNLRFNPGIIPPPIVAPQPLLSSIRTQADQAQSTWPPPGFLGPTSGR